MFIVKLAYRLYLLGVYLGLWHGQDLSQHHAAVQLGHPVYGVALRQGRRFSMEDRVVINTSSLPGGRFCSSANYTYAAVYDGHEGSAACDMLVRQLHPAVHTAAAAAWQTSCSFHQPRLQAAIAHAAHQLNNVFLQEARLHADALQQQQRACGHSSSGGIRAADNSGGSGRSSSSSSSKGGGGPTPDAASAAAAAPAAAGAPGSTTSKGAGSTAGSTTSNAPGSTAGSTTADWDGDDGSTAVFAMMVGKQVLVGNIGNSRAILCTSRQDGTPSTRPRSSSAENRLVRSSSSGRGHAPGSTSTSTCRVKGGGSSSGRSSSSGNRNGPEHQEPHLQLVKESSIDSKDVLPFTAGSSIRNMADLLRQQKQQQQQGTTTSTASSSSSSGGSGNEVQQPSETATGIQPPPIQPLQALPLTSDHTPGREDEAERIRQAGGDVSVSPAAPGGKLRVRGELEVTRSFGDLGFQDQGVVPTPDFTAHTLQFGDAFLVLASDGLFESVTTEEVCQHAWAVWSGSSTIRAALPPPPALALPGEVSSDSGIGKGLGTTAADDDASALPTGCCDCTPQQQLMAAVGADVFDAAAVLRRERRQEHKRMMEQQQPQQQLHVGNEISAESIQLGRPQQQRESILLSEEQQAMMMCRMGSAGSDEWEGHCVWEEEPDFLDEVPTDSASSPGDSTANGADGGSSSESAGTCSATAAGFEDPDADYVDEYAVPDITYSYCPNPLSIAAPYTLAQAIALRLVNEAYNRMSMDNIAVAVLDVREAAEAAAGLRKHHQQQQQVRCKTGEPDVTGNQPGSSNGTTQVARVSVPENRSSSSSSDADEANPLVEESLGYVEDYQDTAVELHLPHCDMQPYTTQADFTTTAARATEDKAQPGSSGSSNSGSTGASGGMVPCEQGSPCPAAAAAAAAAVTDLYDAAGSSSSSSSSTALQRLSGDLHWNLGHDSHQTASLKPSEGTALLCGPVQPPSPVPGTTGLPHHGTGRQQAPSAQAGRMPDKQQQQQQHAGAGSASEAENLKDMDAAGPWLHGHQYVLLQRVADAALPLPSHVHVHPVLGVDQIEHTDGVGGLDRDAQEQQQQQQQSHALSLARHMQPASLLLLLTPPNRVAGSIGREQLCRMLSPGDQQAIQQQQQQAVHPQQQQAVQQQQQQQAVQQQALAPPFVPAHSKQLLMADSQELDVVYNEGFMSACIAGATADAGDAVVPGGGDGLAAVVAALASVPLQGVPAGESATAAAAAAGGGEDFVCDSRQPVEDQQGSTSEADSAAAAAAADHAADDRLIEPAWGRVSSSSSRSPPAGDGQHRPGSAGTTLPQPTTAATVAKHQQQQQQEVDGLTVPASEQPESHSGAALIRAGLLMLLHRPRRTLLAWSKPIQQSLHSLQPAHAPGQQAPRQQDQGSVPGTQLRLKNVLLGNLDADLAGGTTADLAGSTLGQQYKLGKQYGRGHYGEVWSAVRSTTSGTDGRTDMSESSTASSTTSNTASSEEAELLVLKRVAGSRGSAVRRSALREAHFGQLLALQQLQLQRLAQQQQQQERGARATMSAAVNISTLLSGHDHLVRYVEGFTTPASGDVWLVFKNEGKSLHGLMYEPVRSVPSSDADSQQTPPEDHSSDSSSSSAAADDSSSSSSDSSSSSESFSSASAAAGLSVVGPSRWWKAVRNSTSSHQFVASLMQQLLQGLAAVQAANVSHRDVKPENLLVKPFSTAAHKTAAAPAAEDDTKNNSHNSSDNSSSSRHGAAGRPSDGGKVLQPDPSALHLRLIDFGSAVDIHSIERGLYGRMQATVAGGGGAGAGPGLDELTLEYAAPEVIFSSRYHNPLAVPSQLHAYDMWSAGVVMLELVLGTPAVFAPSPATRAALDKQLRLRGRPSGERQLLYLLRGLMELCIYPPRVKLRSTSKAAAATPAAAEAAGAAAASAELAAAGKAPKHQRDRQKSASSSSSSSNDVPIPWSCSDESLLLLIASRDPIGGGLEGGLALRLLQRLLAWDPAQRPTAIQALQHAYFTAARQQLEEGERSTAAGTSTDTSGNRGGGQHVAGQHAVTDNTRKGRVFARGAQQQQQQRSVEAVRALLQQQQAVLQSCSTVAVGEPGWC